ncbi:MAG: bifunctional 4-hydroxy-2-oxoglutarate aldolase/2-dehydro-3-deoxy-phosphogluconate aldolase [Chloroflexi bacterium]|nr:bifunctional 4-hydroxy-2-oxoglutarate aldolase/2-dehydro-3-deoxy-phosphogluconate aldolase [Chloroflexota bacterium]
MDVVQTLAARKIVVVIRLDDLSIAHDLIYALHKGGITILEFTLTNPDALQVIQTVRQGAYPADLLIGVGSVTTVPQTLDAIEAGAQFVVSPIFKREIVAVAKEQNVVVMPGAYTPTEIYAAWESGADVVKVFPARQLGASYIKDVLAPLPQLRLMPTGGISLDNIAAYLQAGVICVGVGGSLLDKQVIAQRNWQQVTAEAKRYTQRIVAELP